MEVAARLTAAAALSAPWFSTSVTPSEDAAGLARTCSGANLPIAAPAVTRSSAPAVTQSPMPEGKLALPNTPPPGPRRRTSPSSVGPSPLPSPLAKSESKRRFSRVERRNSTPSPFSVRPLQVPCSSSSSSLAASDRPSVDQRLSLAYGLRPPQTAASSGSSPLTPMSQDLDDALVLPRADELGEIDDISMRSPITGAGVIPTDSPEEFALLDGDETTDEFGIDMASAIETWKANQAAGGVADESLDVSRASTVCRGLQGMGLDREQMLADELEQAENLFPNALCSSTARSSPIPEGVTEYDW